MIKTRSVRGDNDAVGRHLHHLNRSHNRGSDSLPGGRVRSDSRPEPELLICTTCELKAFVACVFLRNQVVEMQDYRNGRYFLLWE